MGSDFRKSVDFVIDNLEGGDRVLRDSDGVTRWGICSKFHPGVDVANMSREAAIEIYMNEYWEECDCDHYPWPMNIIIFDTAVNQGQGFAKELGPLALDYAEALLFRMQRYSETANKSPVKALNLRGWINRLVKVMQFTDTAMRVK